MTTACEEHRTKIGAGQSSGPVYLAQGRDHIANVYGPGRATFEYSLSSWGDIEAGTATWQTTETPKFNAIPKASAIRCAALDGTVTLEVKRVL